MAILISTYDGDPARPIGKRSGAMFIVSIGHLLSTCLHACRVWAW